MSESSTSREFPLKEARNLVKDLAEPKLWIYWVDLLVSVGIGWTAFVLTLTVSAVPIIRVLLAVLSSLALYRATIFIHELTHVRRGGLGPFKLVWNLIVGFPLLLPSFVYSGVHMEHHVRVVYGSDDDGEYWPFIWDKPYKILGFPVLSLVLPLYYAVRFVVLTPLLVFSKRLRKFTWEWLSSLAIIMKYRRPLPDSKKEERGWLLQEWMACLYGLTAIVLVIVGVLPYTVLVLWYAVTALSFFLNALRTLAAHAYRNPGDREMSQSEQVLDSVNVPGFLFFPALWAPVGLRYHGTHHLYPIMPYHSLGRAHRRLKNGLTDSSIYMLTVRGSLWSALRQLWRETVENRGKSSDKE